MAPPQRFSSFIFLLFTSVISISLAKKLTIPREIKRALGYPKDSLLNFTELTTEYGYESEEHTVVTEDGYILTVFRITKGKQCRGWRKHPPVVLMHGLLQSSDSFIDSGPDAGLAYLISDACFDLWVGNVRGSHYSRKHITMNPDKDAKFWQFTMDEMGHYDGPAIIDYVLQRTWAKKLNYVGFSQGAGMFFVMCSERPEYCDKINIMIALAPATRLKYTKSPLVRSLAGLFNKFQFLLNNRGLQEVCPQGGLAQEFVHWFCHVNPVTLGLCGFAMGLVDSFHTGTVTIKTTKDLFGHLPAGTSALNLAKYGQAIDSMDFRKFDYGPVKNLLKYGSISAPSHNMRAVTAPVVLIFGRNDGVVDMRDVLWLGRQLPNVVEEYEVKEPLWNHLDVTYSQYTRKLIFPTIYKHLRKNSIG